MTPVELTPDALVKLAHSGAIDLTDFPSNAQIDKRAKKDWLSNAVAISQAAWFVANILSRLVGRYQISLLEDTTVAYVICGLVMFVFLFRCPQDMHEQFMIKPCTPKRALESTHLPSFLYGKSTLPLLGFLFNVFVGIHLAA